MRKEGQTKQENDQYLCRTERHTDTQVTPWAPNGAIQKTSEKKCKTLFFAGGVTFKANIGIGIFRS